MSGSNSWAQVRQQARGLEAQTENLFHTYSQFSSSGAISAKPSEEEQKTETQINDLLERREALISQLSRLLDSDPHASQSATKLNNLSRHREVLADHKRELSRINGSISEARNRANLLSNVRNDIDAYHSSEADYMLDERRRIESSHGITDNVLAQAYAINDNFNQQRETLASINRRIVGAASTMPGINSLMQRIGAKKRRDGIILGSFIAFCFLVVFFFS